MTSRLVDDDDDDTFGSSSLNTDLFITLIYALTIQFDFKEGREVNKV